MERKRPEASLKRVLQVAAFCMGLGWAVYLGVLALLYFVIAPAFYLDAASGTLRDDDKTIALARTALVHSRENPDDFIVQSAENGQLIERDADLNAVTVDFRSSKADLRRVRVMFRRKSDGRIRCRVIPF